MRMILKITLWCLLYIIIFIRCETTGTTQQGELDAEFKNYWYKGKAEISSYDLRQARYGQIHAGNAVLIFVTEDFSQNKQVKLDNPSAAGSDKINVLKLNFTKKFNTGIYPYSMMMSVFSPVQIYNNPRPLKIAMSVQEWCGHVFTQLNLQGNDYEVQQFSYFESEGDREFELNAKSYTEDELWNRIRINYHSLPVGTIEIIPGVLTSRLMHVDLQVLTAEAALKEFGDEVNYTIKYPNGNWLTIIFNKKFPHQIISWEERVRALSGEYLTTTAVLKNTLITEYWTKNKNEHLFLRDSLGLK